MGRRKKTTKVGDLLEEKKWGPYVFRAQDGPYRIEVRHAGADLGFVSFTRHGDWLFKDKNKLSEEETSEGIPAWDDYELLAALDEFADEAFPFSVSGQKKWEREQEEVFPEDGPLLDLRSLLRSGDPEEGKARYLSSQDAKKKGNIYKGKKARWVGVPGNVMKIDAELVMPTTHNPFSADQLAAYYRAVQQGNLLEMPVARVYLVENSDIESSREDYKENNLSRPLRKKDLGKPYAVLTDGNHRAFAAVLAGEPFIYVYVLPNHRADVFDRLEGLRAEPSPPSLPKRKRTSVAGREWHDSPEYYGGGEERTRQAAQKAIAAKDKPTLQRIMRSVNAAPDVILAILRAAPDEYSWLMKDQPRLYDLVQEEPAILHAVTDGVFAALVRTAITTKRTEALLGKPTGVLRFSKLLAPMRRGSVAARDLAAVWPLFLEKYASGALLYETTASEIGAEFWRDADEALFHILMEVESQEEFRTFTPFVKALIDRRNAFGDIDASFLWEQFARYADKPTKVGSKRKQPRKSK